LPGVGPVPLPSFLFCCLLAELQGGGGVVQPMGLSVFEL
jgi:hypothetical protein